MKIIDKPKEGEYAPSENNRRAVPFLMNKFPAILLVGLVFLAGCKVEGETETPEFTDPEQVFIEGLPEGSFGTPISTEEPFISRDGKYLFFNTAHSENNKDLHYASRSGTDWIYSGEIGPDLNDAIEVQGNPTMDSFHNFFYIDSGVEHMVIRGLFQESNGILGNVAEFKAVPKRVVDISKGTLTGNMGVEVSRNGDFIFFSRAVWKFEGTEVITITGSDLKLIFRVNGNYVFDENESFKIMKNINTSDLEYAASISSDGLELFFTRLLVSDLESGVFRSRIMYSVRDSLNSPFGPSVMIGSIGSDDFVEGPAITDDGRELYYHKKVGEKFKLFKVKRELF